MKSNWLAIVMLVLLVIGVLAVLLILAFSPLTVRETGLLSTILTLLSILTTWIVSHQYSESLHKIAIAEAKEAHQENLRTFALKAAEKVTNLSDQLRHLIAFLEDELQSSDYETNQELVNSREQRIESAVHMLAMLKSMNDTSLSDWQGVIGDELEDQREEKAEREQKILDLSERLESVLEGHNQELSHRLGSANGFGEQIDLLRDDISRLIAGVSGNRPKLRTKKKATRRDLEVDCLNCGRSIAYRQRSRPNSAKPVSCSHCNASFISRYNESDSDFYLQRREDVDESINCPSCDATIDCRLDTFPGSAGIVSCVSCEAQTRIIRESSGKVRLKALRAPPTPSVELSEKLIEQVRSLLPEQPWPKYVHKDVANDIGVSNSTIQKAIRILIDRGVFLEQIDGELFRLVRVDSNGENKSG